MGKKFKELKSKSEQTQLEELQKLRDELPKLRLSKITTGPQVKRNKIGGIRKQIAKILTAVNTNRVDAAKVVFKESKKADKWTPKSLRPKLSRKIRQALTKQEKSAKTAKQWKKELNFPQRKFAVLA